MLEINSYQQGAVAGAIAKLPTPVAFPDGTGCPRLRTEVQVEIKNNTAGPLDYTFARAKKAAACLFGFTSNWFGDVSKDIFDNAITFDQLRELIITATDDDVVVAGKFFGDYADADVIKPAVAAGASFLLTIEVPRPFELTRLGQDALIFVPGWSQMAQLHSEVKRGGAGEFDTDGSFVQNKASDWLMMADTCTLHEDQWSVVPRIYANKEIGKLNHSPAGELLILGIHERSKTAAQTMAGGAGILGLISIRRAGEAPLHENVQAARVARDAMYGKLPDGEDLGRYVTPLFHLPQQLNPNDLPTGAGILVEMPGAEIAGGAEVGYVYLPAFDDAYADAVVKPNFVGEEKGKLARIKLVNALTKQGRSITSKLATFAPRALVRETEPEFRTLPGDVAEAKKPGITPDVPAAVQAAANSAAASGNPAPVKALRKWLTGTTSAIRGGKTARALRLG